MCILYWGVGCNSSTGLCATACDQNSHLCLFSPYNVANWQPLQIEQNHCHPSTVNSHLEVSWLLVTPLQWTPTWKCPDYWGTGLKIFWSGLNTGVDTFQGTVFRTLWWNFIPGCWSIQCDQGGSCVILRNLIWMGMLAYVVPDSTSFGYFYCGTGEKNPDILFML